MAEIVNGVPQAVLVGNIVNNNTAGTVQNRVAMNEVTNGVLRPDDKQFNRGVFV